MSETPQAQTRQLARDEARALAPGSAHYSAYVGPAAQWDFMGATQFRLLTALGLREHHRLLDIGCGSLRAGRLLLPYLNRGCYFGIEPNMWLVDDAIKAEIGPDTIARKAPRFSDSADFAADSFGVSFDFIVAQSIFSHAGPEMVLSALRHCKAALAPGGLMLATFIPVDQQPSIPVETPGWTYPGCIAFQPGRIETLAAEAGLLARRLPWYHPRQTWYAIAAAVADLPALEQFRHLTGTVLRSAEFHASLEVGA